MTIYWERCSVCGRHLPTKTCWLHPEQQVCVFCCVFCPERSVCPNPVWYPELGKTLRLVEERAQPQPEPVHSPGAAAETRKRSYTAARRKKLEELLRKLSEES